MSIAFKAKIRRKYWKLYFYYVRNEKIMVPFEEDNVKAYKLLLRIEIVLRECIKNSLEFTFGKNWQKYLPGTLLINIKDSQTQERRPQFNFMRLGPLYYLTLGELLTVLQQKYCRPVIDIFGGDIFLAQIQNILEPRNAISHSRPVPSVGLQAIETVYSEMVTALTPEGLLRLVERPDIGLSKDDAAEILIASLQQILVELPKLPTTLIIPDEYQIATMQYWWTDDNLAGCNRVKIETVFTTLQDYNKLPSGVGTAGIRQKISEKNDLQGQIHDAISELEKMKK